MRIDGPEHAVSLVREQKLFWEKRMDLEVIVARLPDCQRRHKLQPAAAVSPNFRSRSHDCAQHLPARTGENLYSVETQTCQKFAKLDEPPKEGKGELVGVFREDNGKLVRRRAAGDAAGQVILRAAHAALLLCLSAVPPPFANPLYFRSRRCLRRPPAPDALALAELATSLSSIPPPGRCCVSFRHRTTVSATRRVLPRGEVETRPDNWHDWFNGLVWLTFPRAKAALSAPCGNWRAIRSAWCCP